MHIVRTVVLRLLIAPETTHELRGAAHVLPGGDPRPFVGEQALVALLLSFQDAADANLQIALEDRIDESNP